MNSLFPGSRKFADTQGEVQVPGELEGSISEDLNSLVGTVILALLGISSIERFARNALQGSLNQLAVIAHACQNLV